VTAAEGDFLSGEITSPVRPTPLIPSPSITLDAYCKSYFIESFRRQWRYIDEDTTKPSRVKATKVKLPGSEKYTSVYGDEVDPILPPPCTPMPQIECRVRNWEIRVWGLQRKQAGPIMGTFNYGDYG